MRCEQHQYSPVRATLLSSHIMRSPLLIIFLPALVQGGICELSYCHCEDTEVLCEGTGQEELFLSPSSLPPAVTSFTVSGLDSLHVKTNAFNDQEDMKEFRLVVTMFNMRFIAFTPSLTE